MFVDASGQIPYGLPTSFVLFVVFLGLMRIGTKVSDRRIRFPAFFLGWLLLTTAAALRMVEYDRPGGGSDAPVYRREFESPEGAMGLPYLPDSGGAAGATEPLYLGLVQLLRMFTDDYHVYFFIVHAIITFGIVFFVAKTLKPEHSILPLLLVFPSWLYSLSAMRNWMAIAIFLVALVYFRRKRLVAYYICIVLAMGFHASAALFLIFPPAAFVLRKLRTVTRKVLFVVLMNVTIFAASGLLTLLVGGGRLEQYLSWAPANPQFMLPYLAVILAAAVFASASTALDEEARRLVLFAVFFAGTTALILYFGGFRYKEYASLPVAVVTSYTLYAMKVRFASNQFFRFVLALALYITLGFEAINRLNSVMKLSGIFPLVWPGF